MTTKVKSTKRLSQFLITLIWISIVLNLFLFLGSMVSDFFYVPNLEDEDYSGNHIFFVLLMWTCFFLTIVWFWIAEFVAFLMWFGRFYSNMYREGVGLKVSPQWAIFSWLIPFYNIVMPLLIMTDMFRAVNSLMAGEGRSERLHIGRLRIWWFFVVAEAVLVITVITLSLTKFAPDLLIRVQFITIVCSTVAAFLCMRFVKVCTGMEDVLMSICRKRNV